MKGKEKEKADGMGKGGSRRGDKKKSHGNLQLILKLGSVDRPNLSEMFHLSDKSDFTRFLSLTHN